MKEVVGRDISRYFYGAYNLESTGLNPYTHTIYANNLLENQFYVGDINQ
jgi:hypothetical protein